MACCWPCTSWIPFSSRAGWRRGGWGRRCWRGWGRGGCARRISRGSLCSTAAFFVASSIHVPIGPVRGHLLLNGLLGVVLGRRAGLAILIGLVMQAALIGHGGYTTVGVTCCVMTLPALAARWGFVGLRRLLGSGPKQTGVGPIGREGEAPAETDELHPAKSEAFRSWTASHGSAGASPSRSNCDADFRSSSPGWLRWCAGG